MFRNRRGELSRPDAGPFKKESVLWLFFVIERFAVGAYLDF